MPIKNKFGELFEKIKAWRHHLHENPELLYDTIKTSAFVEAKLREFGCDKVVTGLGRTGVVGVIHGNNVSSGKIFSNFFSPNFSFKRFFTQFIATIWMIHSKMGARGSARATTFFKIRTRTPIWTKRSSIHCF